MIQRRRRGEGLLLVFFIVLSLSPAYAQSVQGGINLRQAGLEECLKEALENNRRRPASRFAVQMAKALHRQALAGYWPQVTMRGGYSKMDEAVNFIFPSQAIPLPAHMGGGSFVVPEQNITVLEEESYKGAVEAEWLLYDGGMRKGYREQTKGHVDMMKEEARRTDLEIIDSVKRFYWGGVLARSLYQVGLDTLSRMEATLRLTETMYKQGSGRVKKTDWLSNRVMVETLRSMVALLEKNKLTSQAALANTMGLSWDQSIEPADDELPFSPRNIQLGQVVSTAFEFNPDWTKVEAGLRAAAGALKTAKSGHFPKLGLTGELFRWWPDVDGGLATEDNKKGWNLGVGVEFPIFSGMLTQNKIAEAKARIARIKEEQLLLKEGIGLQIRENFFSIAAAEKSIRASHDALTAASENRDLNIRAYQNELVETDEVVTAQLMEALMSAQYFKAQYEHIALLSNLDLIVGTEVLKKIQ